MRNINIILVFIHSERFQDFQDQFSEHAKFGSAFDSPEKSLKST